MKQDQSKKAPAVTEVVETIEEIERNFGPIAYDKAGSILRMFQNALGPELFRDALRNYVKKNHRNVVSPLNFYAAFEDVLTEKSFYSFKFTEAFQTWELQKGYPVVQVSFNKSSKQFHVTQKRFFVSELIEDDEPGSWFIPLNFATSEDLNFDDTRITHFFDQGTDEKIFTIEDQPDWYVFNKQQLGHYRVNYDFENWHQLIVLLDSENYHQIHVLNRAQLVDDAMMLSDGGYLDYKVSLGVLMYMRRETEYNPWAAATSQLKYLNELLGERNSIFNVSMLNREGKLKKRVDAS